MTNKKATKRALALSVVSMLICVAMLLGTTFAWFTDSVISGRNQILAGNLDIELYHTNENVTNDDVKDDTALFVDKNGEAILWEPGVVAYENFTVANVGTLELKYQLALTIFDEVTTPDGKSLSDVIKVGYVDGGVTGTDRDALVNSITKWTKIADIADGGALSPKQTKTTGVVLYWEPTAYDNDYNMNNENQGTELSIEFGIKLLATQNTVEEDSFDEKYDTFAAVSTVDEMKTALKNGITEINFMGATINLNYVLNTTLVPAGTTVTIANANVTGRSYGNGVEGTVIFENCTFNNASGAYSIHFDTGAGDVVFKNCDLYGWNSFGAALNSISLYDSNLYGNGIYALIRSYANLYLENCTYDTNNANHSDAYSEGVEAVGGATLEMVNCTKVLEASADAFIGATEGGNIAITEDITYNNTNPDKQMLLVADSAVNFDGNGSTITVTGSDPSVGNHGYVAFIPPAGENVTVNDLTVTGEAFVELGHYGMGGGEYVANNLVVKDIVSTFAVGNGGSMVSCAFSHYGTAILNNCIMTGTTTIVDGANVYDAGFSNKTVTTINGGEYGSIRVWDQAHVTINGAKVDTIDSRAITKNNLGMLTIGDGAHVGTINLICSNSYTPALTIEDGATVDAIVYKGVTYTQAEWLAR